MQWNKLYDYPASMRSSVEGKRHYEITGEKLPSVTTILGATQSDEKKESIAKWTARVGEDEAIRVRDQAASRGSNMHLHLERYILGTGHKDLTDEGQVAGDMAQVIIDKGLCDLSEIWGSEVVLYYPKRREWIEDYFMQLGAYAMAHNCVYDTEITQGVILMCTPDKYFQKFQIKGKEFIKYQHKFLERLDKYYNDRNKAES